MNYTNEQIYEMLSESHWMLYNLTHTEHARKNKTFREFLEIAYHNSWEALVEFNHIVTPVEEE